ncbi:MAG: serine/threonine-protein kinase, partial [Gemmatimonadota bacterium]
MMPDRWQRVRDLFHAALDVAEDERDAFLRDRADGDDDLLAEVVALLDAAPHAERFLARLADRTGAPFLDEVIPEDGTATGVEGARDELRDETGGGSPLEGRRVGRYRLVRRIGRGGMGAVYLAERDDGQFRKRVALKLLPLGMHTGAARRRFIAERQILARLEHPGIARLIDGGILNDGTPYLVMEYVRGRPIDAWCEERGLPLDDRIELFLQVCDAVDYAHRNLVVHRDLKPSNILVTDDGRVKLLDFGIAKVVEAGDEPGAATSLVGTPMTPNYASPEQIRGEPVTTSSDVYALGVLLYRLLVGRPPYELRSRSPADIEAVVCERDPVPPSRAVSRSRPSPAGEPQREA